MSTRPHLRDAFMATMKDPEFIAEAEQRKLALEPESGEELEALIKKAYATPKPIIERIGKPHATACYTQGVVRGDRPVMP